MASRSVWLAFMLYGRRTRAPLVHLFQQNWSVYGCANGVLGFDDTTDRVHWQHFRSASSLRQAHTRNLTLLQDPGSLPRYPTRSFSGRATRSVWSAFMLDWRGTRASLLLVHGNLSVYGGASGFWILQVFYARTRTDTPPHPQVPRYASAWHSSGYPTRSFSRRTTRSPGPTFMLHGREQGFLCFVTQWNWSVDGIASDLPEYLRLGPSQFANAASRFGSWELTHPVSRSHTLLHQVDQSAEYARQESILFLTQRIPASCPSMWLKGRRRNVSTVYLCFLCISAYFLSLLLSYTHGHAHRL
ncbi:hypothetical protein NMY22_g11549 [Coprinellus aureogranulatus]|nr:hypothetical protein NMY22_g11549 [Coprinellus aureogranulatus]